MSSKKHKGGGRWLDIIQTDDTVEQQEGTFAEGNTAEEIAIELKRKAPDFQAAMAKITFYINRAGKRLSQSRKKELNRVKSLLREMYNRPDRQKAQERIKKSSQERLAGNQIFWHQGDTSYIGDQLLEGLIDESFKTWANPKEMEDYKSFLFDYFKSELPYKNPRTEEERKKDIDYIVGEMRKRAKDHKPVPVYQFVGPGGHKPVVINEYDDVLPTAMTASNESEMIFKNANEALQYLADITGQKVMVAE